MSTNDILFYILIPVIIGVILLVAFILWLISRGKNKDNQKDNKDDNININSDYRNDKNNSTNSGYTYLGSYEEISTNDYYGMLGESEVDKILRKVQEEAGGEVYKNIILKDKYNNYTEIDNIYVSICGIFIIETKAWSGVIEGGYYDDEWEIVLGDGDIIHTKENPFKQNERHVKFFERVIHPKCEITPVVVFIEHKVESIESKDVILSSELKEYILKHEYQVMDQSEYDYVVRRLNSFRDNPVMSHDEYVKWQKEHFKH